MVSILIPVYNTPYLWLKECFISLMKQTFRNFEIVIVNDGSTLEETLIFFKEISDNKLCNIIHIEKNLGITKALNIGLKECKYNLIARMDADDIMHPSRLDYQYRYMIQFPNVDLVGTSIDHYRFLDNKWVIEENKTNHPLVITYDIIINNEWFLNHPTVMFRKDKILSIGGYNEELNGYSEDFDLWSRMFMNNMILHNIHNTLLLYRINNDGLSHKFSKDNDNYIKNLQEKIKKEYKKI